MDTIHALQSVANPALDTLMLWITQIGSQHAYIALLLVTYLAVDARLGRTLALWVVATFFLNEHLKGAFHTDRPFELEPGVVRSKAALATALGDGFPSGHAQSSTTFWGLAAMRVRRAWLWVVAPVVVVLVCVSRLYLGVHLPVDVLGGLALGLVVVGVAVAFGRLRPRPSRALVVVAGVSVPLVLHLLLPVPDSGMLMGAAVAFVVGPALVPYEARGPLGARIGVAALGLVLVFGALLASSALVPDELRHGVVGAFVRYALIGSIGTMATPALARALRLTPVAAPRAA